MGIQERREREKHELRSKILDSARELFIAQGYEAVTMRKIAERIEYSPTAIYLHFKDKDALIRELCVHDFTAFARGFLDLVSIEDPIERLFRAGEVYVRFATDHPRQYRLMFMTPRPTVEPEPGEAEDPAQNGYVFLRATLEQAIAQGKLRPEFQDAQLVAQCVWGAMHGLVSLEIAKGCEKGWVDWRPLELRARTMAEMVMRTFVAESARPAVLHDGPKGAE